MTAPSPEHDEKLVETTKQSDSLQQSLVGKKKAGKLAGIKSAPVGELAAPVFEPSYNLSVLTVSIYQDIICICNTLYTCTHSATQTEKKIEVLLPPPRSS
jgi:hypothetical protein